MNVGALLASIMVGDLLRLLCVIATQCIVDIAAFAEATSLLGQGIL